MSLKPGVQFNFRPRYFAGLGAGMAYVMLQNDSKTGFGFVEEFDGSTQIGYSMEIYAGKKFNYWHGRKTWPFQFTGCSFMQKDMGKVLLDYVVLICSAVDVLTNNIVHIHGFPLMTRPNPGNWNFLPFCA
ncbi:MAG: hypothetical protein IPL50_17665 [Chitinophagaceae bacterium]|nr:hypothetical protein [Chitinophagaceae bacterium]